MMGFETLTLVPFDRRLVDPKQLLPFELAWCPDAVVLSPGIHDQHPLVLSEVLGDLQLRQLDPVELDVVFGLQLKTEDELEVMQGGDFGLEALDRGADQVRGGSHRVMLAHAPCPYP